MKKIAFISLFILFMFSLSSLYAQGNSSLGLSGGLTLLQKPEGIKDIWKDGYMGGIDIGFGSGGLSFLALFEYSFCPLDEDKMLKALQEMTSDDISGASIDGGDLTVIALFGLLKLNFMQNPTGISPYAVGGAGFVKLDLTDVTVSYSGKEETASLSGSDNAFALTFGAGLDIKFNPKTALFFEARWVTAFFEDAKPEVNAPDLGGNFTYIPVKAGFKFYF